MSDVMRWSKFHWADHENDLGLIECSLASQGLWMRLLCYMHRSVPYGHLVVSGRAASVGQIARLVRKTEAHVRPLLEELQAAGVFDRTPENVIFNRRMVRDAEARNLAREYGVRGGNPALIRNKKAPPKQKVVRGLKAGVNGGLNRGLNPREEKRREEKRREEKRREEGTNPLGLVVAADAPTGERAEVVPFPRREEAVEQAAFDAWNQLASESNVHGARSLDADRRKKLRARLAECGGIDGWKHALEQVRHSDLWQGRKPGKDGAAPWVGAFDDILSQSKFRRLMEGRYTDPAAVQPARQETANERSLREFREREALAARTIDASLA